MHDEPSDSKIWNLDPLAKCASSHETAWVDVWVSNLGVRRGPGELFFWSFHLCWRSLGKESHSLCLGRHARYSKDTAISYSLLQIKVLSYLDLHLASARDIVYVYFICLHFFTYFLFLCIINTIIKTKIKLLLNILKDLYSGSYTSS